MPTLTLFEVFVRFEVKGLTQEDAEAHVDDLLYAIQTPGGVKIPTQIGGIEVDRDKTKEIED